jgi:hypothetical protein
MIPQFGFMTFPEEFTELLLQMRARTPIFFPSPYLSFTSHVYEHTHT